MSTVQSVLRTMIYPRELQVWLVDDSPVDRALAEEAFAQCRADCSLTTFAGGSATLAALHTPGVVLPDVILLDLHMPGMDGFEVLRVLKAQEAVQYIPVIMLTTSQSKRDVQQAYEQRASAYLTKAVTFEAFLAQVKSFVEFWLKAQLATRL